MPSCCAQSFRQSGAGGKLLLGKSPFHFSPDYSHPLCCSTNMEQLVRLIFLAFLAGKKTFQSGFLLSDRVKHWCKT